MLRVRRDKLPLLVAAVGAVLPTLGYAQNSNWTFNVGTNWSQSWNLNSNWTTAFPNSSTANAILAPGPIQASSGTVQILTAVTVNTIRVQPTGTNSNTYNFTGSGTLNIVGNNGTIDVTPGGTGGNQVTTFTNSIQTPADTTVNKIGTGVAVLAGNNNWGSGSVSNLSVNQGTLVLMGANAANGLRIASTLGDGVLELNNTTINGFGGLGSEVGGADGMIHAVGNNTWNGMILVTQKNGSIGADAGSNLTINGSIVDGSDTAINGFAKVGGTGTVTATSLILQGPLTVEAGRLKVAVNGTITGTSRTSSLSIAGGATPTASLDLTDNDLVIDYDGASPLQTIKAQIKNAYNGGAWTGEGLTTSRASTSPNAGELKKTGLGYGERTAVGNPSSFGGIALTDSTAVLVKYTYIGDANLDGSVDLNDASRWLSGYSGAGATDRIWTQGDWNYDGAVDLNDASLWLSNYTGSGAGLGSPVLTLASLDGINPDAIAILESMGVSVVPEPATMGLVLAGSIGLGFRRRVRR